MSGNNERGRESVGKHERGRDEGKQGIIITENKEEEKIITGR